jgi:hypothetical protein
MKVLNVTTTPGHLDITLKIVRHSNLRFKSLSTANCFLSRNDLHHLDKCKNVERHHPKSVDQQRLTPRVFKFFHFQLKFSVLLSIVCFLKLYFLTSIFNKICMHIFESHPFVFTLFLCHHSSYKFHRFSISLFVC